MCSASFYDFAISRYQGDIAALTGVVVAQPIDEFNRQSGASLGKVRVPPSDAEVDELFTAWRLWLPEARKYLPAARDYFAASLWRRLGLRINETVMMDIRDWWPDSAISASCTSATAKAAAAGAKGRLVPAINGADRLVDWWLAEVRHLFGADWSDPDAPMLPSERHGPDLQRCPRVGRRTLCAGPLSDQTDRWLPTWSGRLTPHVLRHFCASSLYGAGMDLKALQELLGHQWLATTSGYIHVRDDHIEQAWVNANRRLENRFA